MKKQLLNFKKVFLIRLKIIRLQDTRFQIQSKKDNDEDEDEGNDDLVVAVNCESNKNLGLLVRVQAPVAMT